jgi:hypothetical protein
MVKKPTLAKKIFGENAHMQGSKKVPMPQTKEYGTGAKYKKPPMGKRSK